MNETPKQWLLCNDGSPQSAAAVKLGARLAAALQAQIALLTAAGCGEPERILVEAAVPYECINAALPILPTVRAQTTLHNYDLVVLGDLRRKWPLQWLRGSYTRQILSEVTAPLLVVPDMHPLTRRILMCCGDLWYPVETMAWVTRIAQAFGADVTLLYVVPQVQRSYPVLRAMEDAWGALLQTDTPQGRNLKACREALVQAGIETAIKLRHGAIAEQILAETREGEYDLVALGSTYSTQSLRRYFVGSVTDAIVEQARRPVLVVRHNRDMGSLPPD